MKRNVSLVILACEIAAIVILHAVKMNQQQNQDINTSISNAANLIHSQVKHSPLLSIK
jgi:hypothetical protein